MIDSTALLTQATDAYSVGAQTLATAQSQKTANMSEEQARKASKDFESFFIGQMLEYMNTDIKTDGLFGGGHSEEVWRSMLNQEYGKEIAKSDSIGVSDAVMRSLLQAQGEATASDQPLRLPAQAQPVASVASKERMI